MHRHRRVPQAGRRHDVPELHGDARGRAQHARAGRTCCSRCCGARSCAAAGTTSRSRSRSTCACRARRASRECPTNVDIATYRAEFLSHYYEHASPAAARLRVRHGGPMAVRWRRSSPVLGERDDAGAGLERAREEGARTSRRSGRLPRLAPASFRKLARPQERADGRRRRHPVGRYVQQLISSGDDAGGARRADGRRLPRVHPAAAALLRPSAVRLRPARSGDRRTCGGFSTRSPIRSTPGFPIVVLEPSCASVFRDELRNLLPGRSARGDGCAAQTFLLSEFLERQVPGYAPPQLPRRSRCCTATAITRR